MAATAASVVCLCLLRTILPGATSAAAAFSAPSPPLTAAGRRIGRRRESAPPTDPTPCRLRDIIYERSSRSGRRGGPPPPPPRTPPLRASDGEGGSAEIGERAKLQGRLPIASRTVPLGVRLGADGGGEGLSVTVWEVERPSEMMELWWSSGESDRDKIGDPFGVVMWPGSVLASREMARRRREIEGKTVLVLGAGTGLEAQAAALLGAGRVIATDINKLTLKLLSYGANRAGLGDIIEGRMFDVLSEDDLPHCDVVLAADILYNEHLGMQMGLRCTEILSRSPCPKLIVTDSQRFHGTDFLPFVNKVREREGKASLCWEEHILEGFTGSGMLVEGDQTYDVKVRMLSFGWGDE